MVSGRKADDKLSTNPQTIRARLRRGVKHTKDLEIYIEQGHMKPLDEWDVEELARGRPRNSAGTFAGRAPEWLTIAVVKEAKRRLLQHTFGELASHVDSAVKVVVELMMSTDRDDNGKPVVDSKTKLAAAQFIIEHVKGKPQAHVEVDAGETVREFLASALLMEDPNNPGQYIEPYPIIEGSVVEDDDSDLRE